MKPIDAATKDIHVLFSTMPDSWSRISGSGAHWKIVTECNANGLCRNVSHTFCQEVDYGKKKGTSGLYLCSVAD
jgi:hypothetical protein